MRRTMSNASQEMYSYHITGTTQTLTPDDGVGTVYTLPSTFAFVGSYPPATGTRSVVRDWRHLRESASHPEYVMSPQYDFNGIGFTLEVDEDTYTGVVGPGTSSFPVGRNFVHE